MVSHKVSDVGPPDLLKDAVGRTQQPLNNSCPEGEPEPSEARRSGGHSRGSTRDRGASRCHEEETDRSHHGAVQRQRPGVSNVGGNVTEREDETTVNCDT